MKKDYFMLFIFFFAISFLLMSSYAENRTNGTVMDTKKQATDNENTVIDGNARFTVLTPTLIRTEYSGDGVFENRRSFNIIDHNLPTPAYTTTVNDGWREIQTEKVLLRYKQNSGAFDTGNLTVCLTVNDNPVVAKPWLSAISGYREEAENANLLGGAWTATDHTGYTGTGFVAGLKTSGAGMEWAIRKNLLAGDYLLSLKYSSGKGAQTISLYIDDVKTQITLPATTDWDEWKLYQQTLTLSFGQHTFKVLCDESDTKNVNIDWIHLTPFLDVNLICEAENALMIGGVNKAIDHTGFSGTGFAAGFKKTGDGISWDFNPLEAGNYIISWKYANGIPGGGTLVERTLSLYIDGVKIQQLVFPPTTDWDTWDMLQQPVSLTEGAHTIQVLGDAGDSYHLNFDWLTLTPAGAELPVENIGKEKTNLGGWSRGLDTKNKAIPLWDGILSRDGWYLLDDSETALFDKTGWIVDRPVVAGGYQDGYFFGYGTDYQTALKDFYKITGNPVLLPKWAFGVWYSINSETYTNAAYYQNNLLPSLRANKIPLDVLVIDTDWKTPERWNGWNWHTANFPDPQGFMNWAKEQGLVVPLNVHPTINNNDPKFTQTNTAAGGLIADGNKYHFDFSRKSHAEAYLELLQPFNQQGVRFWWNDQAEKPRSEVRGAPVDSWINHLYTQEGNNQELRGFAFSRIGSGDIGYNDNRTPGIGWSEHRYTLHFTGDAHDTWDMLAFQSTFTIREANIGIPYVSHDLGSYHGAHLSDDMYMRWVQFGVFQPIFRLHSKRGERLPWQYPNVEQQAGDFIRLRHALVPYTYSLAYESSTGGMPIVRGMYLYYPIAEEAYTFDHQYLYGEKMLVSPVATPGTTASSQVWFPEGVWTNYFTNETIVGPMEKNISAGYSAMPVFVKAGGIIPLAPYSDYVGQITEDSLTLKVYTGDDGEFSLYEDEGENLNYQAGKYALTKIVYNEQEKKLTIKARQGNYPGAPGKRSYDIELFNAIVPEKISVNGTALNPTTTAPAEGWSARNDVIHIHLNNYPVTEDLDIILEDNTGILPFTGNTGMKLFPNPATKQFTLEINGMVKKFTVSIYNVEGEEVLNKLIVGNHQTTIDTQPFSKGIYLVKVNNGNHVFTEKLIIR